MSINKRELQKFLDVFGPVVAAIPAVISAVERETELETHTTQLQLQLTALKADFDAVAVANAAQVVTATEELNQISLAKLVAAQEVSDFQAACKVKMAEEQAKIDTNLRAAEARVTAAKQTYATAERSVTQLLADTDKQVAAKMAELNTAVAAAEKRVVDAEAAFDKLRSKLS